MAWKNENAILRKERVKDKSWFTRVKSWWNNLLNPDHDWIDYESAPDSVSSKFDNFVRQAKDSIGEFTDTLLSPGVMTSLVNSWTGAGPTGQQVWANETQMQNAEDIYQRQVTGMQKAGLNPALMYQNGSATNAPTVQGQPGTANMSDIMQALLLDKQSKLLESQTRNVDADTDKKSAETENLKLINQYYPSVTQTEIDKMLKEMGKTDEEIKEIRSRVNLNELDQELKKIQKIIQQAEANESSAYFKATRQLQEARTEEAKSSARASVARALIDELDAKYIEKYDLKLGSSEWMALASALANILDIDLGAFGKNPFEGLFEEWKRRRDLKTPAGSAKGAGGR